MSASLYRTISGSSYSSSLSTETHSSSDGGSLSSATTSTSLPLVKSEPKNEVMYLNELVTAEFDRVVYQLQNTSTPFEMFATLYFGEYTITAAGYGAKKKDAKRAAAAAILKTLGRDVPRIVKGINLFSMQYM